MNLLYISHAYPPHGSGVGSFVQEVAQGMVERGHRVWVVEPYHPSHGAPLGPRSDRGVTVVPFGERFWPFRLLRGRSRAARLLVWLAHKTKLYVLLHLWQAYRCSRFVARLAAEHRIDVVEVSDGNESGAYTTVPIRPARLVVRIHGSVHLQEAAGVRVYRPLERWIYRNLERRQIRRADALVGVSAYVSRQVQRLFALPESVPVIYNLAPRPPDRPAPHDAPTVVFVGRIGLDKGVDTLARAWNAIASELPGLRLQVLGTGDESLMRNALSPAAAASVDFLGSCSKDRVFDALAACRLFVLPSRYESFSIALLEALAIGCPIVYTNRCSGPEVIEPGVSGLLVDPDDADALARAMLDVLTDAKLRDRLSAGARRRSEDYRNREAWLDENEQLYAAVVEKASILKP